MLNMQDFHEWLSSTVETSEAYQRSLANLTKASLTQILNIEGPLSWAMWKVDQSASAN
jgi:hypothetical protein